MFHVIFEPTEGFGLVAFANIVELSKFGFGHLNSFALMTPFNYRDHLSEQVGITHETLDIFFVGFKLSSLSCSSLGSSNSLLHDGNVINSDSADVGVSGNVVNVVLAENATNLRCSSSAGDLARLHEDIAVDLVEEGIHFDAVNTVVLQVRIDLLESLRAPHVTIDGSNQSFIGSTFSLLVDLNLCDMGGHNSGNVGDDLVAGDAVGSEDSLDVVSGLRGRDALRSRDDAPDFGKSIVSLASLDTLLFELSINLSESLALGKSFLGGGSLGRAFSRLNTSQMRGVPNKDIEERLSVSSGNLSEQFVVLG
jgi:hypothetical protein